MSSIHWHTRVFTTYTFRLMNSNRLNQLPVTPAILYEMFHSTNWTNQWMIASQIVILQSHNVIVDALKATYVELKVSESAQLTQIERKPLSRYGFLKVGRRSDFNVTTTYRNHLKIKLMPHILSVHSMQVLDQIASSFSHWINFWSQTLLIVSVSQYQIYYGNL